MSNDCIDVLVFFNTPQNNLLHNLTRHGSETERPVVPWVILLVLSKADSLAFLSV